MFSNKDAAPSGAGRYRKWLGLCVLMLPVLLVTVDNTILGFALPPISSALHPSASQQLWMIDAYSLVLAGLLITMGGIGDRVGHRALLLVGATGFALVSALTALSESAAQLIAGRAFMGIFGAMLMPSTLALIRTLFQDREQRRVAVAVWATTLTVGSALGPLIGGVLLEFFNWPSIFLIAVPVLIPLLVFGPWLLPESQKAAAARIDFYSVLLSVLAMAGVVYGIKHVAASGLDRMAALGFIVGALAGVGFVRRQLRLPTPLMDLKLFTNGSFTGSIFVNLLSLALLVGFVFFTTQALQIMLGLSPLRASLALVPGQVMAIVIGMAVVPVAQRVAAHRLVPILLAFTAAAFLLVASFGSGLLTLVVAFALLNIGVGAIATVSNDLVLSAVPPEKASAASAISETAYEVGVVLGTTVLGGLVTAFYRGALRLPESLSDSQAWLAGETLAGAYGVATGIGEPDGARLISAASEAFGHGITVVSWLTGMLVLVAMVVARRSLR